MRPAPMRLVFVERRPPCPSDAFAFDALLALERAGSLEAVFATEPGDPGDPPAGAEGLMSKVRVLAPGTPAEQAAEVAGHLDGAPVTAVHGAFVHAPAEVAARVARRLGIPYGLSVGPQDRLPSAPDALAEHAREAACVIAPNADVAAGLRRAGAAVQLVPHGIDLERFRPTTPRDAAVLTILAVGRTAGREELSVVLDAAARLLAPVRLRIVGGGPERATLERRIAVRGLGDRVEPAGPSAAEELPAELAAAHIVVVPSAAGPAGDPDVLPEVVLQAMSAGRPVVAGDTAALRTAVVDGRTGVLVRAGDPEALAGALEFLVDQPNYRRRLGREARAHVERDYELHSCTARLRAFLETVYA